MELVVEPHRLAVGQPDRGEDAVGRLLRVQLLHARAACRGRPAGRTSAGRRCRGRRRSAPTATGGCSSGGSGVDLSRTAPAPMPTGIASFGFDSWVIERSERSGSTVLAEHRAVGLLDCDRAREAPRHLLVLVGARRVAEVLRDPVEPAPGPAGEQRRPHLRRGRRQGDPLAARVDLRLVLIEREAVALAVEARSAPSARSASSPFWMSNVSRLEPLGRSPARSRSSC